MKKKKRLHVGQQASGDVYRMFRIISNDIAEIKACTRWARKNCVSTICVSELKSNTADSARIYAVPISRGSPARHRHEYIHNAYVGFTDDEDSMAFRLTLEDVSEVEMWDRNLKFSVYEVIEDE